MYTSKYMYLNVYVTHLPAEDIQYCFNISKAELFILFRNHYDVLCQQSVCTGMNDI